MSYFGEHFWGDKNHGFEVLYHCVKQGPVATKELADFIRERANIEETYSKAMAKLSKLASNGTPMGTFAPLWEVFRVSSDKLALCHLELTRKLHDLLKDVLRYGEEQLKTHKKCKEEVLGTVDAVQMLSGVGQLLPKSRENYLSRCMDLERLRRENTSQKEMDKAETKSKKAADSLRRSVNMAALTEALQHQAEQNPTASYYNLVLLRYQFSRPGPESVPLQMSAHWQCGPTLTRVSVEYSYRAGATAVSTPLTNAQAGLRGQEHPFQPGSANSSVHKQALAFSIL